MNSPPDYVCEPIFSPDTSCDKNEKCNNEYCKILVSSIFNLDIKNILQNSIIKFNGKYEFVNNEYVNLDSNMSSININKSDLYFYKISIKIENVTNEIKNINVFMKLNNNILDFTKMQVNDIIPNIFILKNGSMSIIPFSKNDKLELIFNCDFDEKFNSQAKITIEFYVGNKIFKKNF